jgi:hypothetical protein
VRALRARCRLAALRPTDLAFTTCRRAPPGSKANCDGRVVRGGSWEDSQVELRSAARTGAPRWIDFIPTTSASREAFDRFEGLRRWGFRSRGNFRDARGRRGLALRRPSLPPSFGHYSPHHAGSPGRICDSCQSGQEKLQGKNHASANLCVLIKLACAPGTNCAVSWVRIAREGHKKTVTSNFLPERRLASPTR